MVYSNICSCFDIASSSAAEMCNNSNAVNYLTYTVHTELRLTVEAMHDSLNNSA